MWKVVPLSKGQLMDVREDDILNDGLFRKCSNYRGGGGYDQFPYICESRLGKKFSEQFIAQLFGCNLDCPYCYVTRAGVWGGWEEQTTEQLVDAFKESKQEVFHLMGGAPALYIQDWAELIRLLEEKCPSAIFHSDIMLTEKAYNYTWLTDIAIAGERTSLFAVDIKGLDQEEHLTNTRKPFLEERFWSNLQKVEEAGLNYYFTFTNVKPENIEDFWKRCGDLFGPAYLDFHRHDAFSIDLIDYDALPYVDEVPWGAQKLTIKKG